MIDCRALLLALSLVAALTLASSPAQTHGDGAPSGHSGAPGEPDCTACHVASGNAPQAPDISLEGLPERIQPGESYALKLVISSAEIKRAGFQLAVRSSDGEVAGQLAAIDERSRVEQEGPEVLVHTERGSRPDQDSSTFWNFEWAAPMCASGEILFAIAINNANDDDSAFGDQISSRLFLVAFGP